ncbi:MAG: orotidine 5'-phosphate decarboxylase / HUMPS family protein, partial [bacterium]|nr:orotidine 5'-phosphate decarboxylase / HUMPS family protein [bacterium]
DLKLHDIPKTVRARTRDLVASGADIITVHIPGGIDMMMAALEGAAGRAEIWGITALTSLSEEDVHLEAGHPSKATVLYRARMAKLAGLQAVVCSPKETAMLAGRPELTGLTIVNPGVRSAGVAHGDQARVDTPIRQPRCKTSSDRSRHFTLELSERRHNSNEDTVGNRLQQ